LKQTGERSTGERIRVSLDLSPRSVTLFLSIAAMALLILHVTLQVFHYQVGEVHWLLKDAFDVDEEENIPTWFSAMLLAFSALLLFTIARCKRDEHGAGAGYWKALAIGFVWLSLDEVAGIHETFNTWADEFRGDSEFSWVYAGAAVFVMVAVLFVRFLLQLPRRTRFGMCAAGILYGCGALGIEIVSHFYLGSHDMDNLSYNLQTAVEEGLEMAGVILFIHVLTTYMQSLPGLKSPSR
jgi:hypothetical protein